MSVTESFRKWYRNQDERSKKWAAKAEAQKAAAEEKKHPTTCVKCKSKDIHYSFETIKHKRSAPARTVGTIGKIGFAPATLGLSLLLPTAKKGDTFRVATCNNCGNMWSMGKVQKFK